MLNFRFLKKTVASVVSVALGLTLLVPVGVTANAADGNLVSNGGFESGTAEGWSPRGGNETLTVTSDTAYSGRYSLLVTDREENWNGASYDLTGIMQAGRTYDITAYVKARAGQSSSHTEQATLTVQRTDSDGEHYDSVAYCVDINENNWTKLSGRYTLTASGQLSGVSVYIESPDDTLEYYIDDVSVVEVEMNPDTDLPSLCEVYQDCFDIGVAVDPVSQLDASDPHSKLIGQHFNSLTAGNVMKISSLQPVEGYFNFTEADRMVDYAIAHHMKIRGHNLLWHNQVPDWFFTDPNNPGRPATRDQLLARLKTHITTVLRHFRDKYGDQNPIYCWDVCNEVISDSHANNGLRGSSENSKWLDIIGPDYIEKAFEYAHEADPNVKLYINDYNIEDNNQKTIDMYNLVKSLLDKGVPIDGIGLQMHINNNYPSVSDVKASIEKFASLGIDLQITEMDCSTQGRTDSAALQVQADKYKALFDVFVSEKQYISSVTFWGISDDASWLGANNAPLLFDSNLKAKPAFYAIAERQTDVSNSTTSPTSATFDKNPDNQADITVKLTLNGNTLSGIYNGSYALVKGVDYTVSSDGTTVTILKSYLSSLNTGTVSLKFDFNRGADPSLSVNITDTSSGGQTPGGDQGQTGDLKVQMVNGVLSPTSNTISARIKLINTSDRPIDLSTVKLRYYYTKDGTQQQNFWCDWSSAGTSNVTGTFLTVSGQNADTCLEIGFKSGTGTIAAGAETEIHFRIANADWSNYNQSNDYSFNSTATSYVDWSKMTAYIGDTLVWGNEPV